MIKKVAVRDRRIKKTVKQKGSIAGKGEASNVEQKRLDDVDPIQISVDEQGRLIINDPALAAAIRTQLNKGADPKLAKTTGLNIIACGNNCGEVE